jgi:hypothetical protein
MSYLTVVVGAVGSGVVVVVVVVGPGVGITPPPKALLAVLIRGNFSLLCKPVKSSVSTDQNIPPNKPFSKMYLT